MRIRVLAVGGLAAALAVGGGLLWRARRAGWVETRVSVRDFVAGLASVQPDLKLVVGRAEFLKVMTGESAKSMLGLDLGTTRAALTVPVRVHYAVDLAQEESVVFRYDRARRVLEAGFADPRVQAVEVLLQDKRLVVEPGWARLRERSGRALEEALERGVYDAAKRDAEAPAALAAVREQARPVMARFLEGYLLRAGVLRVDGGVEAVAVRFRGEPEPGLVPSGRR
ncbi:MAG: hypothetical protein HY928_08445 [Elusimicrobia bacterium]|nr:hypothetical protein [Elusimicrobiota bacterium]